MEDSLPNKARESAIGLGMLVGDYKGADPLVMDLTGLNSWTDFFVITTVSSTTHMQGLLRHIKDYAAENGLEILRRQRKTPSAEEWSLIDLGSIVVHLMTGQARSFYELERLWVDAPIIWCGKE